MDHFTQALETELRRQARRSHSRRRLTARAAIAGPVVVAVVAGLLLIRPGADESRAAALPVLKSPRMEAGGLPSDLRQPRAVGDSPSEVRQFDTPYGRGFALVSEDRETICLAVPDKVEGFGSTCTSMSRAQESGVVIRLLSERGSGPGELVMILPTGARVPGVTDSDGNRRPMKVSNGVAAGLFSERANVAYDSDSGNHRLVMEPYVPEGQLYIGCGPNHRAVPVPDRQAALHPEKYCDAANGR